MAQALEQGFGSYDAFAEQFKATATGLFGSGWVWLVANSQGAVSLATTTNANLPLRDTPAERALLVLDVWEHAYYLDFQNNRAGFIDGWLERLVNWEFAARNFAG